MRTTLTLDDDIAQRLEERARELGKSFKDVVNLTIRQGLATDALAKGDQHRNEVLTVPIEGGLRPGIDPDRMNQLADELDGGSSAAKLRSEG